MFFEATENNLSPTLSSPEFTNSVVPDRSPQKSCNAVSSRLILNGCGRKRRSCVICRWEDRWPKEKTDYCGKHNVCLCRGVYSYSATCYMCPDINLTCWDKFHRYYLPKKLYSDKGNL
ncbi:Transposase [Phytophthora megakarya]|uniref:Transposase n=1 Tax=Phytophthora megakarya TaxID=4795 RepID=A0A225W2I9_9STRA|nr:Transposase [Phytophthora megakarya]